MKKKPNQEKSKIISNREASLEFQKDVPKIKMLILLGFFILFVLFIASKIFSQPEKSDDEIIPTQPTYLKTEILNYTILNRLKLPEGSYAYTLFILFKSDSHLYKK